jgi:hypothetical protein
MTEYELLQLQATYEEALGTNIMNYISILSGYLLASYFLGNKISKAQFVILTLTYSVIMLLTASATVINFSEVFAIEIKLQEISRTFPSQKITQTGIETEIVRYIIATTQALTFLGSIYFSLISRRSEV